MIGYFGYLQFEVRDDFIQNPQDMERVSEGRYEKYYSLDANSRPKKQFLGAELDTFTFTMHLDQNFNDIPIRDILADMVTWTHEGYAAELVIGTRPYGYNLWTIKKLTERFSHVLSNGVIASAEVEVTLEEY